MPSETGWVACSSGDPTRDQLTSGHVLAGSDHICFTHWNADNQHVIGRVERVTPEGIITTRYQITPEGTAWSLAPEEEVASA